MKQEIKCVKFIDFRRILYTVTELRDKGINKGYELAEIIDREIKDGVFPVSTKDRMKLLFGDDCVKAYTTILEDFKQ